MDSVAYFQKLFVYDHWANRGALRALQKCAAPPVKALQLLGHVLAAEKAWRARLPEQDSSRLPIWPDYSLGECETRIEREKSNLQSEIPDPKSATRPACAFGAPPGNPETYLGLFIAVLAVSWASIFIRWCEDAPALIIAFYRMLWSSLLFVAWSFRQPGARRSLAGLSARERGLILAAGFLLALHFAAWIASLKLTTIAHSLTLESTHPVFAVLLSPFLLKEKAGWRSVAAVLFTLAGIIIIGGQDVAIAAGQSLQEYFFSGQFLEGRLYGDLLAVASALFLTLYLFIARYLRSRIDLVFYLALVYGAAALILLLFSLAAGHPLLDYPLRVHIFMLLLALIPTGVGHSLLNWAARRIEAYKVSLAVLGEPVLASIMAYFFFGETPYGWFYAGAGFILAGIVLAMGERRG